MKKTNLILIVLALLLVSCNNIKLADADNKVSRFKVGTSTEYEVGFFDESKQVVFLSEGILYPFKNGYTVLQNEENMTLITSQGKVLFKYKTDPTMRWSYSEGYFSSYWTNEDHVVVYGLDGKRTKIQTSRPIKNGFYATYNADSKKMYYKSITGKELRQQNNEIYYSDFCDDFYDGFAIVSSNNQYGIINLSAEEVVEKKFLFIGNLKYGYAIASKECGREEYKNKTKPLFGVIDMNGSWVVAPNYYEAMAVSHDKAVIKSTSFDNQQDCGWGIYNFSSGAMLILEKNIDLQIDCESNEIFFDEAAIFCFTDNCDKYGIINSNGNILLEPICSKIEPFPDNGFWRVLVDNKWMLFKEDEGLINPEEYLYGNYLGHNFLTGK